MSADSTRPLPPAGPAPAAVLAAHDALPPGTRFAEFEIIRVLGVGGFGIVYLAQDHSLERQVALKEYMPASLAQRGAGPVITVRSGSFTETYAIGLRSFINEARLLARFDHPALVKVYRFWEDNATAYMVMPYLQGITLRDARRAMVQAPDEAWIRSVLEPMLDALERLHGEGVFHRDIAPDNILLPPVGSPILLDFGAARRVISDRTQALTAILKPGYAPIEQYADMTAMRQGPWTDIYALGAVLHFLLFGAPPASATARALQSDAGQIERRLVPGVSPRFLAVVAWMLGVRPLDRPQSVAGLRAVLNGQGAVPSAASAEPSPFSSVSSSPSPGPDRLRGAGFDATARKPAAPSPTAPATFPQTLVASGFQPTMVVARVDQPPADPAPAEPPRPPPALRAAEGASPPSAGRLPTPRRGWMVAGLAAGLVVAAVVMWQFVGLLGSRPNAAAVAAAGAASANVMSGASGASGSAASPVTGRGADTLSAPAPAQAQAASTLPDELQAVPTAPASAPASAPAAAVAVAVAVVNPAAAQAASAASPVASTASRPRPAARPNDVRNPDASAASRRTPTPVPAAEDAPARPADADGSREAISVPRAAAAPTASGPLSAREACSGRAFIALAICMDRECEHPQFRDSPECVRVLNVKRQRAER